MADRAHQPTVIAAETSEDRSGIRAVLVAAFERPGEANLVEALRRREKLVSSFVARTADRVVGTAQGTAVRLAPSQPVRGLALGPMAVHPEHQHRGVGSELVRRFIEDARNRDYDFCVVLGDPAYYERFGFRSSTRHGMRSTFDVPPEVFMALRVRRTWLGLEACVVRYEPEFASI